jgi:hypothetical protein
LPFHFEMLITIFKIEIKNFWLQILFCNGRVSIKSYFQTISAIGKKNRKNYIVYTRLRFWKCSENSSFFEFWKTMARFELSVDVLVGIKVKNVNFRQKVFPSKKIKKSCFTFSKSTFWILTQKAFKLSTRYEHHIVRNKKINIFHI